MTCPACRSIDSLKSVLPAQGDATQVLECRTCGSIVSRHHGTVEMVRDAHEHSFLGARTPKVECDDFAFC